MLGILQINVRLEMTLQTMTDMMTLQTNLPVSSPNLPDKSEFVYGYYKRREIK